MIICIYFLLFYICNKKIGSLFHFIFPLERLSIYLLIGMNDLSKPEPSGSSFFLTNPFHPVSSYLHEKEQLFFSL